MKIKITIIFLIVIILGYMCVAEASFDLEFLWKDSFDYSMLTDYANPLIDNDRLYFVVRNIEDYIKGIFNNDFINIYDLNSGIIVERMEIVSGGGMVNPFKINNFLVFPIFNEVSVFRNNELVWRKKFDSIIIDAIHDKEYIYINSLLENKKIIKLNTDGEIKWAFSQDNWNFRGLEQDDFFIYTTGYTGFGGESNYIYKINKKSGHVEKRIENKIKGNLFVNKKYIIVDSSLTYEEEKIYVYNKNGEKLKTINGKEVLVVSDDYIIYTKDNDNTMICLNANSFVKEWETTPLIRVTLYEDKLYGYKTMGPFTVIDVTTGDIIWQDENNRDEDFASGTTPVINDDYVITINESDFSYIWVYKKK